jgi:hypothetical protein
MQFRIYSIKIHMSRRDPFEQNFSHTQHHGKYKIYSNGQMSRGGGTPLRFPGLTSEWCYIG